MSLASLRAVEILTKYDFSDKISSQVVWDDLPGYRLGVKDVPLVDGVGVDEPGQRRLRQIHDARVGVGAPLPRREAAIAASVT